MITEDQKNAFGFAGKNQLWEEICKLINALQEQEMFSVISRETRGEDRIHAAGRVDGINLVASLLEDVRQKARALNGLTDKENLA